ncbi:hypothetical protein [Foetidibacter luteolus]|uniref:hypothetical protein n=1 Tax=Foetidibacter luteolus TaxID=2608880 RepID=UPI00129B4E58|nr:hypothetical protein [Foetidibacter luteolus]
MKLSYISASLLIVVVSIFCACSSAGSAARSGSGARIARGTKSLQAVWTLSSITADSNNIPELPTIPLFEDANYPCLTGGEWTFSEDAQGSYSVTSASGGCVVGTRKTNWLVLLVGDGQFLQFKRAVPMKGIKADRFTNYIFEIESLDGSTLKLKYPVYYQGRTEILHFTYSKKTKS